VLRLRGGGDAILNQRGSEHFYGCAAFPLYDPTRNPAGLCGRRIDGTGDGPDHLYLPGPRRGLFNRQAARSHREIILTEAVIDSLTLIAAGILNTIPCYGTNGGLPERVVPTATVSKQKGLTDAWLTP